MLMPASPLQWARIGAGGLEISSFALLRRLTKTMLEGDTANSGRGLYSIRAEMLQRLRLCMIALLRTYSRFPTQ